ncbi:MAG: beta-galactosidase trimerization domain-containing protein [Verrucomicrobia bacterium]|nr:beta-galactosidase trimerization domain-containing protein [Verrucomicrobiota bacterium]
MNALPRKSARNRPESPRVNWWEQAPLRIIEICNNLCLDMLSLKDEAAVVKRLGANVQHFHCMLHSAKQFGSFGLDDRGLFFKTSLAIKKNPDRLGKYLPLARKAGLRVLVYFNVHCYTAEFGKRHPDWLQIKECGAPKDDIYDTGVSFCVNTPYREWVFQILRDLCAYDIDGIFYDGPVFFADTCYCDSCKQRFAQTTGKELPLKSDPRNPLWKQMVAFQSASLAEFLKDSNAVIQEAKPGLLFYMNGNSNWPSWPTARDNHAIVKHTGILGAEGGFIYGDLNQTPIYKPGMAAKLLSSQSVGRPCVVFNSAGHKPWSWYLLPRTEISLLLAQTIAHGAQAWVPFFPPDLNQPELDVVARYNAFIKKHPDPFFQAKSLAKVALLWPSRSANFYSGSSVPLTDFTKAIQRKEVGDVSKEFVGFYEGLTRAQTPFDVMDEAHLDDLGRYQLLLLPNAACLSSDDVARIRNFVAKGGDLVATFESSLYDESGARRDDFQLRDLFGVAFKGSIFGPMHWDYVSPVVKARDAFLRGITRRFVPATTYGAKVESASGTVSLSFCEKLKGCYDDLPDLSNLPFLIRNNYEKGRVVYLAGTFGATLNSFRFPEYLLLVRNLCNALSRPAVAIVNAPWVEVQLAGKKDAVFLHLINHASGLKRPLTQLHPLAEIRIELREMQIEKARALRLNRSLSLHRSRNRMFLTLPRLDDYEVIAMRLHNQVSSV